MDPRQVFCPNPGCPARWLTGKGNIGVHSRKERRYKYHACGGTFAASTGTVYYLRRTARESITLVITLLALWLTGASHRCGL